MPYGNVMYTQSNIIHNNIIVLLICKISTDCIFVCNNSVFYKYHCKNNVQLLLFFVKYCNGTS